MVQVEQEHVLLVSQLHQCSPEQRPLGQVEGALGVFGRQLPSTGFSVPVGEPSEVDNEQSLRAIRGYVLKRLSIQRMKGGAQGLVAPDDFTKALLERGHVERAAEAIRGRYVVG